MGFVTTLNRQEGEKNLCKNRVEQVKRAFWDLTFASYRALFPPSPLPRDIQDGARPARLEVTGTRKGQP